MEAKGEKSFFILVCALNEAKGMMKTMSNSGNNIKVSWLHISDLHLFPEADTTLMLEDYSVLANSISPQFLIVTGDFRHKNYQANFSYAKKYLEVLMDVFGIDKKDVFLVPGNHDVNHYEGRKEAISDIIGLISENNYNVYSKYTLCRGFSDYIEFVNEFYSGSKITDARVTDPSGVYCIAWNNLINILSINTALISDGEKHEQILDINTLSQCKIDFNQPTIMIGHHGLDRLYSCFSERVENIIDRRKISAYLHGDSHQYANDPISKISTPNSTIPSITCAKSAPQSGDSFSDIGVVYYEWMDDDNTYVQAYRWTTTGFIEDSTYYHNINKRYSFPMVYDNTIDRSQIVYKKIKNIMKNRNIFMAGEWLKEAETIWKESYYEGIGRCLLLFYYEKATEGVISAYQQAQEIYRELEQISDIDSNTQKMLEATKRLLF